MNALTAEQPIRPQGRARSVRDPILIEIEQIDDVCFLRLRGHFNSGSHSEYLSAKMDQIKKLACTKFLADLEDVASVGSAGVSFIVGLLRASGGRLVLVGIQPQVHKVLDITCLSTVIPVAADIESGLAKLLGDGSRVRGNRTR